MSMAREAIIEERPVPPEGRLSFPMLMLRILGNPVASWGEDFYREGIVVYRWLGIETAFVMNPKAIESILLDTTGSYSKQPLNDEVFGAAIGGGLLSAEGEDWRWQRRLTAPMFRADDMLGFVPAFAAAATPMLERWKTAGPGAVQDIDRDMTRVTFQALQDTVLGASVGEEERRFIEEASAKFLVHSIWKVALSSLRLPPWIPHPGARAMARDGQTMRGVAARVLARARESGTGGNDLLQRLITARDPATGEAMPDRLIIDNLVTFLVAGHETTSQALTWSLYLLALFPEWQERLREEVRQAVGDGGSIARDDIAKLVLLDQAFQEAMRLYSPVPLLMRLTTRPVTVGDVALKKGAMIIVPIYVIHRHRRLWQDPLTFDPSRFSPEAKAGRPRCAYMPFGAGPRTCIGGTFAMVEGKTLLARILASARLELPEGEQPLPFARITLRPKGGLKLKVTMLDKGAG
ncbi:cytochrome P450 [Methyloceanibacter sp.]|uniref:cytochrome P450 n=1 Tax=Methyloceanibacter sp. TaxID=1965321 RepID=UPI002D7420E2|nr:cytochrome P450 [Methyloceanibacter sp.]HZP09281.1 cytochrome P450 [Methyloceanibacter sp.]